MMIIFGIGFLVGLGIFAFVALFLGYTVKFENMKLEDDE